MSRRRATAAGAVLVLAAGGTVAGLTIGGGDGARGAPRALGTRTAAVQRRDLVARVTIDGQLGYADERPSQAGLPGTVTWLAPAGSIVRPGHSLYRLDDQRVLLLSGALPAWRAFAPGMSAGRDVLELETNLERLGFDPYAAMTVDGKWTSATTAAVKRFQRHVGLGATGRLELGRVVFLNGVRRVSSHDAKVGDTARPGQPVLTTTSARREVNASLSADDQGAAHRGDRAIVDLPDGSEVTGRIASVGAVARSSQDGGSSIDVTITLPAHGVPRLDKAPVSVSIARQRLRNATAVPVIALLARPGGGYGVEVVGGGRTRLVAVTPGLFADGWVQVDGVRPGQRVAVPQ